VAALNRYEVSVSQSAYSYWEKGIHLPKPSTFGACADALGFVLETDSKIFLQALLVSAESKSDVALFGLSVPWLKANLPDRVQNSLTDEFLASVVRKVVDSREFQEATCKIATQIAWQSLHDDVFPQESENSPSGRVSPG
jgi:transcriptional regulator with XRE-family HTH domain